MGITGWGGYTCYSHEGAPRGIFVWEEVGAGWEGKGWGGEGGWVTAETGSSN